MKKLHKNVYIETTSDGLNIGCVAHEEGAVSIDLPQSAEEAVQWRDRIKELTPKPLRAIIFTAADRVNSDALKALAPKLGPFSLPSIIHDTGFQVLYAALEADQPRLLEPLSPVQLRERAVLPEVTFSDATTITLGTENPLRVDIAYAGGYTPGGATVAIRDTGILFCGWLAASHEPPVVSSDGALQAWLTALTALRRNRKIKIIVPASGPTGDLQLAADTQEYLKTIRSAVRKLVRARRPRESVIALVPELLSAYTGKSKAYPRGIVSAAQAEEMARRIQSSLEHLYDSQTADALGDAQTE